MLLAGPEVLGSIPRSPTGFWSGLDNLCMHTASSLSSQSHYGLWLFGVIVIAIMAHLDEHQVVVDLKALGSWLQQAGHDGELDQHEGMDDGAVGVADGRSDQVQW